MQFAYKRLADPPMGSVVSAIEASAARRGFVVLKSRDLQAALTSKGFPIRPLVSIELGLADEDQDALMAVLLPCRLSVYEEDGMVAVCALRPSLFREVYPERDLEDAASRLEVALTAVVDDVCGTTH